MLPAELSAAAVLMTYWTDANPAIWISIFLVIVVAINLAGTRIYGEAEFWFASIKVITIVGLIILSVCIDLGAGDQGRLGFRCECAAARRSGATVAPTDTSSYLSRLEEPRSVRRLRRNQRKLGPVFRLLQRTPPGECATSDRRPPHGP